MVAFFILVFVALLLLLIALIPFYGKIGGFVLKLFGQLDEDDDTKKDNN